MRSRTYCSINASGTSNLKPCTSTYQLSGTATTHLKKQRMSSKTPFTIIWRNIMAIIRVLPKLMMGLALLALAMFHTNCLRQDCDHFYGDLAPAEQRVEFLSYDPEKQIDIYLCGLSIEPPDYHAAQFMAEE